MDLSKHSSSKRSGYENNKEYFGYRNMEIIQGKH